MSIFLSWIKQQDLAVVILYKQYNRTYCKRWKRDYKVHVVFFLCPFHSRQLFPTVFAVVLFVCTTFFSFGTKIHTNVINNVLSCLWFLKTVSLQSVSSIKLEKSVHLSLSVNRSSLQCFSLENTPRGGTLGISGWGCAARTLEPPTYTRAAEF